MFSTFLLFSVFLYDSGTISQWPESTNYIYLDDITGEDTGIILWWSIANTTQQTAYFYAVSDQGDSEIAVVWDRNPLSIAHPEILPYDSWSQHVHLNDLVVIHNKEKDTYALFVLNDVYESLVGNVYADVAWYWNQGSGNFHSDQNLVGPNVGSVQNWTESGNTFQFDDQNSHKSGIQLWWSLNTLDPPRCFLYAFGEYNELAVVPKGMDPREGVDPADLTWTDWASSPIEMGDWVILFDRLSGAYGAIQVLDIYGDYSEAHSQYLDCTWYYNEGELDFHSLAIQVDKNVPPATEQDSLSIACHVFSSESVERVWFEVNDIYAGEAEWNEAWKGDIDLVPGKNRVRIWAQDSKGLSGSWYQTVKALSDNPEGPQRPKFRPTHPGHFILQE